MKKTLAFILVCLLCFSVFAGCSPKKYHGPLSCISYIKKDGLIALMDMPEDVHKKILSVLNKGEWQDGVTNCGYDYEFTTKNETIRYHSECGTFTDVTNRCMMELSEPDKEMINGLLGVKNREEESHPVTAVRFLQYDWSGNGISQKTISTCELAYSIIDAFTNITATGETVEKISDDVLDENSNELPIERGTMWLEIGAKIYRMTPDFSLLCRVETHLGKGYVLNFGEELKRMLADAWQYYPYDFYKGVYQNDTDEITLEHVYTADSDVQVEIKNIAVEKKSDPRNKITLELFVKTDQMIHAELWCQQSDDNLAEGDSYQGIVKTGQPETIELNFGGFMHTYYIYITIDNTRIELEIKP